MVGLVATWLEGECQVCLLKDSSLPHRMAPILALVHQGRATRMEKVLEVEEGALLDHHNSNNNSSSLI